MKSPLVCAWRLAPGRSDGCQPRRSRYLPALRRAAGLGAYREGGLVRAETSSGGMGDGDLTGSERKAGVERWYG